MCVASGPSFGASWSDFASDQRGLRPADRPGCSPDAGSTLPVYDEREEEPCSDEGQIKAWQQELVNLTRRNKLLYLRHTKSWSLEIEAPAMADIWDRLESGGGDSTSRLRMRTPPTNHRQAAHARTSLSLTRRNSNGPGTNAPQP
jgi:hypothetical protein